MSHAKETLTRNTALQPEPVKPEITLGDEEVSDVSLATFHVFEKENAANGQRLSPKNPGGGCGCSHGCRLTRTFSEIGTSIDAAVLASGKKESDAAGHVGSNLGPQRFELLAEQRPHDHRHEDQI